MTATQKALHRQRRAVQTTALFLMGFGLLVLGGAILAILLKAGQTPASRTEGSAVPARVNFPAPGLSLNDLSGSPVSLADYGGQVVLVNNWATWCPPCRAEMPALQSYYEAHREQGFSIVAIEAGEPASEVARFVSEYGLTFPVWLDPQQQALAAFKNLSLPNSYLIDRDGDIRLAWAGAISLDMLEKFVTPVLEE